MKLSVIIAALNEADLGNTIQSLRDTAGSRPEVIVVDDSSIMPIQVFDDVGKENTRVIHNPMRCGVGPSRTIGVLHAKGEYVMICDAHMRFTEGWYEETLLRVAMRPKTVHCATCLAFDSQHMDLSNPTHVYTGGSLNVYGKDRVKGAETQVMEPIWGPKVTDDTELPCVMGAAYVCPRDWFLTLNPLAHLREWGSDELFISLKSWLAGGDCRYMWAVRIGHKFLLKGERQRFNVRVGHTVYNRLFGIYTLVSDPVLQDKLVTLLKTAVPVADWVAGWTLIRDNWGLVAVEQARNAALFKHDFRWFAAKFALPLPA